MNSLSPKEDIQRLEEKVDILYNLLLMSLKIHNDNDAYNMSVHLECDVFGVVNVRKLTETEIKFLGVK